MGSSNLVFGLKYQFKKIIDKLKKDQFIAWVLNPIKKREPQPGDLLINYIDKKGDKSKRIITVKKIKYIFGGKDLLIQAVCHQRHDVRNFIASRILSVTEIDTGEMHEHGIMFFKLKYDGSIYPSDAPGFDE